MLTVDTSGGAFRGGAPYSPKEKRGLSEILVRRDYPESEARPMPTSPTLAEVNEPLEGFAVVPRSSAKPHIAALSTFDFSTDMKVPGPEVWGDNAMEEDAEADQRDYSLWTGKDVPNWAEQQNFGTSQQPRINEIKQRISEIDNLMSSKEMHKEVESGKMEAFYQLSEQRARLLREQNQLEALEAKPCYLPKFD